MSIEILKISLYSIGLFFAIIGECTMIFILSAMLFRRSMIKTESVDYLLFAHLFFCLFVSYPLFMDKCIYGIVGHLYPQLSFNEWWCRIKSYLIYSNAGMYFYTVLLQAAYRFSRIVYPTRIKFQSFRLYLLLSIIQTIIAFVQVCPSLIMGGITYLQYDYVCQFAPTDVYGSLFICSIAFLFPFTITIGLYVWTMYHVRKRGAVLISVNQRIRIRRDVTIMTRLVVLLTFLTIVAAPHGLIPITYAFTGHIPLWTVPFEWTMTIFALVCVSTIQILTSAHLRKLYIRSTNVHPIMTVTNVVQQRTLPNTA